jgi:2-dehydropantoate 2-reductase
VVLAVKHPDLPQVVAALPDYLARCAGDTVVLAVQNGVVHLSGPLATAAPERTLVGSVYIFSHVEAPGVIRVLGGPRLYRFGPLYLGDDALAARARDLAARWLAAGLFAAAGDDGARICWEKLCLLAPLSGMTALTSRTVGEIRELPDAMHTIRTLCTEVREVGLAEGVALGDDLVDFVVQGLASTDPEGRSSLHRDLAQGRDSELDVLLGDVVRRAGAHGVPVPAFRTLYAATRVRYAQDVPGAQPGDPDAARAMAQALSEHPQP